MMSSIRSRAVFAAALLTLAACGEETPLLTTLAPADVTADVEMSQAAFETPQTDALAELGDYMDIALDAAAGSPASIRLSSIIAAGPNGSPALAVESAENAAPPMANIAASLLGKTLVWDVATSRYVLSSPALTGAPANGVRFYLYQMDTTGTGPVEPLVQVGHADLSREGTESSPIARLVIRTTAGVKVFEYVVTKGGTAMLPSFRVDGTAGIGVNTVTFSLNVGVNLTNGTVTATWRTLVPSRNTATRTTLAVGEQNFTINGVLQRGLTKVQISGTLSKFEGGTVTVKVGDRLFATITTDGGENVTVTGAEGAPLTEEEQEVLRQIFAWFDATREYYSALLIPIYTILGIPRDNS